MILKYMQKASNENDKTKEYCINFNNSILTCHFICKEIIAIKKESYNYPTAHALFRHIHFNISLTYMLPFK